MLSGSITKQFCPFLSDFAAFKAANIAEPHEPPINSPSSRIRALAVLNASLSFT